MVENTGLGCDHLLLLAIFPLLVQGLEINLELGDVIVGLSEGLNLIREALSVFKSSLFTILLIQQISLTNVRRPQFVIDINLLLKARIEHVLQVVVCVLVPSLSFGTFEFPLACICERVKGV